MRQRLRCPRPRPQPFGEPVAVLQGLVPAHPHHRMIGYPCSSSHLLAESRSPPQTPETAPPSPDSGHIVIIRQIHVAGELIVRRIDHVFSLPIRNGPAGILRIPAAAHPASTRHRPGNAGPRCASVSPAPHARRSVAMAPRNATSRSRTRSRSPRRGAAPETAQTDLQ